MRYIRGKKALLIVLTFAFALCMAACGASDQAGEQSADPSAETAASAETQADDQAANQAGNQAENLEMRLLIGDEAVEVDWEENDAVAALREQVQNQPLTIDMSMYEDFEQVGELGMSLPAEDEQIETKAGDIMLYSGDKIVVFYGSNSWAYTRLGRITDKSPEEMAQLLGNGDVQITITGADM